MTKKEEVPGFAIVKTTTEGIARSVRIESVKYDFDKMVYNFLLSSNGKTCEVLFSRRLLEDLNDYTGSKKSKYWQALESNLKKRLSIEMQKFGLVPFSSDIFFEDIQEWESDDGHNIDVFFSKENYEIFQDGLKQIFHYLEEQKTSISYLKLQRFPYEKEQEYIQQMLLFRNMQISENGPCSFRDGISVTSRIHLKAAALIELILLENELSGDKYSETIKKEIAAKASRILYLLSLPVFERIEVAEYIHSIRKDLRTAQSMVAVPGIPQKKTYDIVLSFAGEDREYAGRLAELLKRDSFVVFYDESEEHDLWGKNLYDHLTEVYSKLGRYCVMFLSRHYAAKQWPTLERRAAQERAFKENEEYILPIRIDDTEIPGMLGTVAYQDLREKSIEAICEILKKKLLSAG